MVTEVDIRLAGGRTLHAYHTRADGMTSSPGTSGSAVAVFWLHGSPNVGSPPEPLFAAAEANGLAVPVLIMHGAKDKMVPCAHGEWLAAHCPAAELRTVPDAGHITVLDSAPEALTWLAGQSSGTQSTTPAGMAVPGEVVPPKTPLM